MTYTVLPSVKGQITIPPEIRQKYGVSKETPFVIEDNDNGVITLRVMKMVTYNDADILYREDNKSIGLHFKKPMNPHILLDAIRRINQEEDNEQNR